MTGFRLFRDGNRWCAVGPDFEDLATSPAGFGTTTEEAVEALRLDLFNPRWASRPAVVVPSASEFAVLDAPL